ncbi:MAG: hypothetical protein ABFC56_00920, partial [Clostridiaceae bacterium]
ANGNFIYDFKDSVKKNFSHSPLWSIEHVNCAQNRPQTASRGKTASVAFSSPALQKQTTKRLFRL